MAICYFLWEDLLIGFLLIMKLGGVNLIRYIVCCLMFGNKKKEGQSKIGSGELYN